MIRYPLENVPKLLKCGQIGLMKFYLQLNLLFFEKYFCMYYMAR